MQKDAYKVLITKTVLADAQAALGQPDKNSQAIIPMINDKSQHPDLLPREWDNGKIFWQDWNDILIMQELCNKEGILYMLR